MTITTNSTHLLAELWGCDRDILDDVDEIKDIMEEAAIMAKATPLHTYARSFDPSGVTAVVAVSESHLSIHTWPEKGYAAVDIFTCGEKCRPENALEYIKSMVRSRDMHVVRVLRGRKGGIGMTSFSKAARVVD